jgi:hypothetical protein
MGVVCLHAALLIATPALAQHAARHDDASRAKEADEPAGAGQAAAFDRSTGRLRALTAEEARGLVATEPGLQQSDAGLVQVQHADGTVSMDLEDRFQEVLLAKTAPDGAVDARCVTTAEEAKAFLGAPSKARPPKKATPAPARTAAPAVTPAPLEEK